MEALMGYESTLSGQSGPSSRNPDQPNRVRFATAWAVAVVAALLTVFTAFVAYGASTESCDYCADLGWFFAGIVALAALAGWVIAVTLFRTTGWVVYVVAAVFVALTGTGLYALFIA
jgi:hypothetical protein